MQNDKTTLRDLAIFSADGGRDVFALIDHTTTHAGRDTLRRHITRPPDTYEKLQALQDVIKFWAGHADKWPASISNGTLVMLEKYFESADVVAPPSSGLTLSFNSFFQKIFNKQEYFFIQFSLSHLADLLRGCAELVELAKADGAPPLLLQELKAIQDDLDHRLSGELMAINKQTPFTELKRLNYKARREMKHPVYRLMTVYARLDAWHAMALATNANKWIFPTLELSYPARLEVKGLWHPLLEHPVSYDIAFDDSRNFLLLTGANMSGKTTFMRSLGVGALLAHLGMGAPATGMRISFLQGIITNMLVEDNILRGESYFFAEVQRMKQTAEKLSRDEPHLVLMDELFKGTNVHDAYECTKAVVEGLLNHPRHLMILSTHLYEVAQLFSGDKDILFSYFVTTMSDDGGYQFTYELKQGVSNDRIGYRILKKEGVIDLLNKNNKT